MEATELTNLFWLLPSTPREWLLLIRPRGSTVGDGLRALFGTSKELILPDPDATEQWNSAFVAEEHFDCVFLDIGCGNTKNCQKVRTVKRLFAALAPDDTSRAQLTSMAVFRVKSTFRPSIPRTLKTLERALAEAGFSQQHAYALSPSAHKPSNIIPATRSATRIWVDQEHGVKPKKMIKRLLITVGLHTLLFDDFLVVGVR